MEQINVYDDPEHERYVVEVDGESVGFTVYHLRAGGRHFFVHTEIFEGYEGMGLASTLVRSALDDVRSKGGVVVPICPYVAEFITKNPEYDDLVDHETFDRIAD
ncbi:MAG: GNAT family N-acetyltransferase, partial [Acidimicrobiia bacterium]